MASEGGSVDFWFLWPGKKQSCSWRRERREGQCDHANDAQFFLSKGKLKKYKNDAIAFVLSIHRRHLPSSLKMTNDTEPLLPQTRPSANHHEEASSRQHSGERAILISFQDFICASKKKKQKKILTHPPPTSPFSFLLASTTGVHSRSSTSGIGTELSSH